MIRKLAWQIQWCTGVAQTVLALLALSSSARAQNHRRVVPTSAPTIQGHRLALVIGNAAYPSRPLANSVNDANDLGRALHSLNFETEILTDVNLRSFDWRP